MSKESPQPYGLLGLLWRMAVVGTLVAGISLVGGYVAVHALVETPGTEAPDLLTMEVDAALSRASEQGFSLLLEKREPSDLLAENHVLAQRPAPGTIAKLGSTIRVTVASRP